jgi:predicted MFS family arabinose efflux permease
VAGGREGSTHVPATFSLLIEEGYRHGIGLTIGLFNSAMNPGLIFAPLIGGTLMDHLTLGSVFYAAGFMGAAGMLSFSVLSKGEAGAPLSCLRSDAVKSIGLGSAAAGGLVV